MDKMLKTKEAAEFLGVSCDSVRLYCKNKGLKCTKSVTGIRYFNINDLIEFKDNILPDIKSRKHMINNKRRVSNDLTGLKFGMLTVQQKSEDTSKPQKWTCICDCGETTEVNAYSLTSGSTRSCGCLLVTKKIKIAQKFENNSNYNELYDSKIELSLYRKEYNSIKSRHCKKNFNIKELITLEQFISISQQPCKYCGEKHSIFKEQNKFKNKGGIIKLNKYASININGLDRVDSSKGYTFDNVVPCCTICNRAKSVLTIDEFLNWVDKVYNYNKE